MALYNIACGYVIIIRIGGLVMITAGDFRNGVTFEMDGKR
jgi:hypothetical protein